MRRKQERIEVPKEGEVSKKAVKHSSHTFWGSEPTWNPLLTSAETELEIASALNWYNTMVDEERQKDYLVTYCRDKFPDCVDALIRSPQRNFHPYGALARMIARGAKVPDKWVDKLNSFLLQICKDRTEEPSEPRLKIETPVVKRDPKISEFIGTVDRRLDKYGINPYKFPEESMADYLFTAGATPSQINKVLDHFTPRVEEFNRALTDPETAEYYSNIPTRRLQKMVNWLTSEVSEETVKAAKKIRREERKAGKRKRKVSPAILVKRLIPKRFDSDLQIQSIEPESIIGAQQLWIFNTEKRKLCVFYAADEAGLTVYRKSITNYDEESSVLKTIRKPQETIPPIVSMGKVELRNVMDKINSVASPIRPRINDKVLLLKVVK